MKILRNEKGITLVELLATLAIGSLIIVFIMSIHLLIQKQYGAQKEDAQGLTDVTIAIKEITKEIRFTGEGDPIDEQAIDIGGIVYRFEKDENGDGVLLKDDRPYLYNIESFVVNEDGDKITLKIKNTSGEEFNTEIIIR